METALPQGSLQMGPSRPWVPRPDVSAVRGPDATVLMDSAGGKYFKLNATGSLIWDALVAGKSRQEILAELQERFPQAAGPRLQADLDSLLEQLGRRRLIVPLGSIPDPVLVTTPQPTIVEQAAESVADEAPGRARRVLGLLLAYTGLVLADLVLLAGGYHRFYRLIKSWPLSRRKLRSPGTAAVCAEVDAAALLYFKRAWCLQRSAVTACLLRREGRPAQMVVGVRELPFAAHSWVELGGRVINDDPRVRLYYREIERL